MDTYEVVYDPKTGKPRGIQFGKKLIGIDANNKDFRAFLEWNATQPAPLDYQTYNPPAVIVHGSGNI